MMPYLILIMNSVLMSEQECQEILKCGFDVDITLCRGNLATFLKYYDKTSSRR